MYNIEVGFLVNVLLLIYLFNLLYILFHSTYVYCFI